MWPRIVLLSLLTLAPSLALALYDPSPSVELSAMQGEWAGELTYLDYSGSGKHETLPTRMFASLSAPSTLVLHYVFDDGPGKTVHSYEQMNLDFERKLLTWRSDAGAKPGVRHAIVSSVRDEAGWHLVFEARAGKQMHRYQLDVGPARLEFRKMELAPGQAPVERNRFSLRRGATPALY